MFTIEIFIVYFNLFVTYIITSVIILKFNSVFDLLRKLPYSIFTNQLFNVFLISTKLFQVSEFLCQTCDSNELLFIIMIHDCFYSLQYLFNDVSPSLNYP